MNAAGFGQPATDLTAQVFLAYAAEDGPSTPDGATKTAVQLLCQLLNQAQITYWQCPHPWPPGVDPEVAISRATEACDNFVMVLSPHALADAFCLQGLLFALSLNKRIVPVLVETVPQNHLPEPLQTLSAIDLRTGLRPGEADLTVAGRQLVHHLHHGADYHRAHTRLLMRALQWERQRRDPTLLLEGDELVQYQRWLWQAQGRSQHQPIRLQALYVAESDRRWSRPRGWLRRWL
ncbi:toll/interleukin-1 receptor domain-containing protein [Nodosilinea sp. PGN35]|uniref:toll/interleukin-1 receptor domain-containing protein n=1 Tax=Nodosilinea sp. PGN35 TaxID=3020489 RepID=UPI0023B2E871|nr:toll/interleukin-1 receptor domain-containing protein [Nodosilinea sp. TSF1-S3]